MATTPEQFTEVEQTLKSSLNPVFAIAGIANPLATAVMFGIGILFRFVRLGAEVRRQNEAAGRALEEAVRAEGIFRMPVDVNLDFSTLINFILHECELLYPIAYQQLEAERKTLLDKSDPGWKDAFETLEVAYRVLPEVYFDLTFDDNPVLDDLFGKWLDPGNPDFGSLVRELRLFMQQDELSVAGLQDMLPTFVQQRLQDMGVDMQELTQDQLDAVQEQLGGVVADALTGEEGLLQETLGFAMTKRQEGLEERLQKLGGRREHLESLDDSQRSHSQRKELDQVIKRIEETENMLNRITALA